MGNDFLHHYEVCKNELFTYLMYRVNFDKPLAEDLLMDVVFKAYSRFSQFDSSKGSFKNWIFTLARNHLINAWRDRKETVSLEVLEENGVNVAVSPNTSSLDQEFNHHHVHQVLQLLKNLDRELIALRYLHDLSIEEMSQILQKQPGTVRTALSRALQQFKERYQKLYPQTL